MNSAPCLFPLRRWLASPGLPACSRPALLLLLDSCETVKTLRHIHGQIVKGGLEQDNVIATRFLCACNSLRACHQYASSAFDRVAAPNSHLWNTIIKTYSSGSPLHDVVSLFKKMMRDSHVRPDSYTFPQLLKSCSAAEDSKLGTSLHCCTIRFGVLGDLVVDSALIDMYGKCEAVESAQKVFDAMVTRNVVSWTALLVGHLKCGCLESARKLFDDMPERNVAAWNSMIDGYAKAGEMKSAQILFDEMPERNIISFTALINGYAKAGDMVSARSLFDQMKDKDPCLWSVMISGYAQSGRAEEAVKMFAEMIEQKTKPDKVTMAGFISACAKLGNSELAKKVDLYVKDMNLDASCFHIAATLIDMNAKCGNMERAICLFESSGNKDLITYCSMMQGYSIHGRGEKAVELFHDMLNEGFAPDQMAFSVVLTACSHSGLVENAHRIFQMMRSNFDVTPSPEHYAIMVDLLGRSGQLKDAYELIKSISVDTNANAWATLLNACFTHGDIKLAEIVAKRLFEIAPQHGGNYVALSNVYADANRWNDVSELRSVMKGKGIHKDHGCSRLEP